MRCRNSGVAMSVLVNTDMATPIIDEIGNSEQKAEFLAPLIAGEKVAALGVTEPNCGSDVAALQTTARSDGGDYVINGAKTFITNAAFADFITLAVRTGDEGMGGISLVLLPTDTPGFTVGRKLDKLGTRSVDSCEIHFENCRIPKRNLLGQENMGFLYVMQNFQGERLIAALMATAGMDLQMKDTIRYGQERHAFGRPIMSFQLWKHRMADHTASLEAARALTYRATDVINTSEDPLEVARWVTMCKLFAGDLAQKVVYDCLQMYGGYGYIEEYDIARAFRDTRLMTIGGGTTEIMQKLLAKLNGW
jgi:citronellyl-CoA dehydrogenase